MLRIRFSLAAAVVFALLGSSACAQSSESPDWTRFRGPNGSGITTATSIPTEFSKDTNLVWRLDLPQGHSSPILWKDRIYLTAFRDDVLSTLAIDRHEGRIVWEREAPAVTPVVVDARNNPASPSPAVEDDAIYSFFPDYGLIAYDDEGNERWKVPLGPFDNIYGMGASPVIVGDLLILACDQSTDSFLLALDKRTGEERWRTMRPEAKSGHATPILWTTPEGEQQVLLPGSFLMTAYAVETGERRWWVRGLSFEIKSTPVISGDTMFINGYGAPVNDPGNKIELPSSDEVWAMADADDNGTLSQAEFPDLTAGFWFGVADLDTNRALSPDEWEYLRAALDSENGMLAIRMGGEGDTTESAVKWKYQRAVPQLPSPLVFEGVLYMVNDGGIVTTLDPETGERLNQGRLTGALGSYYASPVAADGHIYFTSELGAIAVLEPTGELTPMVVNDLVEDTYATPAFADGRIYIRTVEALYAFGG